MSALQISDPQDWYFIIDCGSTAALAALRGFLRGETFHRAHSEYCRR